MFQRSIWKILPLIALSTPLSASAKDESSLLPMTLGKTYSGTLTPSPTNPQGEVCYKLAVKSATRVVLDVKTEGIGIVKFAVYDKIKALQFFYNDVSNQPAADGESSAPSRFSFPAVSDAAQLCLTTTNSHNGQKYDFTITGKPRKTTTRLALRTAATKELAQTAPAIEKPAPPAPNIEAPPTPTGEPYCYVGTWQIADLNAYWLPIIQNFTQAKITDPQMVGYAKIVMNKDGTASFEAVDLEQKYLLRKSTGAKIDRLGVGIAGSATARFTSNPNSSLTFSSQNYQRLTSKLNLGANLKFTGDRLFLLFGDRELPPVKLPYRCIDRDNLILKVPAPTGQKLVPISLKRIG